MANKTARQAPITRLHQHKPEHTARTAQVNKNLGAAWLQRRPTSAASVEDVILQSKQSNLYTHTHTNKIMGVASIKHYSHATIIITHTHTHTHTVSLQGAKKIKIKINMRGY